MAESDALNYQEEGRKVLGALVEAVAVKRGVIIEAPPLALDMVVRADYTRLKQVLLNLLLRFLFTTTLG